MNSILRIVYAVVVFWFLMSYHILSSFILCFIPRILRRKKDIKGQRVLITGAGNGVGRELAIEFSKYATCLVLVDIDRKSLLQTEKLLDRCSPVFIYDCDVSDYKKVYEMANRVQYDVGDIDILVNNAGIVSGKFLWDLPEEKIMKTMGVNALAHFWMTKAFIPSMIKKNRGHIVSIISLACKSGIPQLSDYCASKFAAMGFAESLEMELRQKKLDGIKVTTVCPSLINTELFKGADPRIGAVMSPTYVAREVVAGVLEDEEMIILPQFFKYFAIIKELVPRWIHIRISEIVGISKLMDTFVGREQSKNQAKKKE